MWIATAPTTSTSGADGGGFARRVRVSVPLVCDLVMNATFQHLQFLVEQTTLHVWGPFWNASEEMGIK